MDQQRGLIIAELVLGILLMTMFLANSPIWSIATVLVLFMIVAGFDAWLWSRNEDRR